MLVCKISDRFGALNPALNAKNALHGNTIWPISIHPSQIGKIINIENDNLRENYYLNICTLTDQAPFIIIFKDSLKIAKFISYLEHVHSLGLYRQVLQIMLKVIYQTRATVFHQDIQTPRRELKIRRAAEYF